MFKISQVHGYGYLNAGAHKAEARELIMFLQLKFKIYGHVA